MATNLWWSAFPPEGSDFNFPDMLDSCPSCALHARLSRAEIGWIRSVPYPVISHGLGSCKLKSPILSAMKSRDPKTNLKPG
jgi:hypothetical protein